MWYGVQKKAIHNERRQIIKETITSRNRYKKIKLRWNTLTEVRRSLAKINNMVANCELPAKEANAIFYSANLVLKALEMEAADKKKGQRDSGEMQAEIV